MNFGELKLRHIIFYICITIYVVNLIAVIFSGNYIFLQTTGAYNYISLVMNAVFLFVFYSFLKRGSLTTRYLHIMFVILVVIPFIVALLTGGVKF